MTFPCKVQYCSQILQPLHNRAAWQQPPHERTSAMVKQSGPNADWFSAMQAGSPIMHLRTMNAYIASALDEWSKADSTLAHVPLQAAPTPCSTSGITFAGQKATYDNLLVLKNSLVLQPLLSAPTQYNLMLRSCNSALAAAHAFSTSGFVVCTAPCYEIQGQRPVTH